MNKVSSYKVSVVGLGVALNIIGTLIAFSFKIPILMDSLGTVMISALIGPIYGVITGILSSIVSGISFDIYSLYFAPVQIFVGLLAGIMFNKGYMEGKKRFLGVLLVSSVSAFTGAIISAFLFGGITSSSSSYIVVILFNLGFNKVLSVFLVQFLMDYVDRFIAVFLVVSVVKKLPIILKRKLGI